MKIGSAIALLGVLASTLAASAVDARPFHHRHHYRPPHHDRHHDRRDHHVGHRGHGRR